MIYFRAHEFVKLGRQVTNLPLTVDVCDKIKDIIFELNPVRERYGKAIIVTSAYRPVWWEKTKGRSGESEHTFKGKGAVDLTCSDLIKLLDELQHTKFTRIAVYPGQNFVHCDYKFPERGQRFFVGQNWDEFSFETIKNML